MSSAVMEQTYINSTARSPTEPVEGILVYANGYKCNICPHYTWKKSSMLTHVYRHKDTDLVVDARYSITPVQTLFEERTRRKYFPVVLDQVSESQNKINPSQYQSLKSDLTDVSTIGNNPKNGSPFSVINKWNPYIDAYGKELAVNLTSLPKSGYMPHCDHLSSAERKTIDDDKAISDFNEWIGMVQADMRHLADMSKYKIQNAGTFLRQQIMNER